MHTYVHTVIQKTTHKHIGLYVKQEKRIAINTEMSKACCKDMLIHVCLLKTIRGKLVMIYIYVFIHIHISTSLKQNYICVYMHRHI